MTVNSEPSRRPPADDWPRTSLEEASFAPDLGERIDDDFRCGRFVNLHAVLVA